MIKYKPASLPAWEDLPRDLRDRLRKDGRHLHDFARAQATSGAFKESSLLDEFERIWKQYSEEQSAPALYYLVQELLSGAREATTFSVTLEAWTERLARPENFAGEILNRAFLREADSAFREACESSPIPWVGPYIPRLPVGDDYDRRGAKLFQRLLEEYRTAWEEQNLSGDLVTHCWERMSGRLRRRRYVIAFCCVFGFPRPGQWIDNKYRLETIAGIGGMGIVFRAMHKDKFRVALKMVRPDIADKNIRSNCTGRELFVREGRQTVKLTDRRFVVVKDSNLASEMQTPFFTMDYVEGGRSLTDLMDHRGRIGKYHLAALYDILKERFSKHSLAALREALSVSNVNDTKKPNEQVLAAIVLPVAEAIQYLHDRGYLHCDLKPGNILLSKKNGPLVADLGLSSELKDGQSDPAQFVGTVAYSSPEQVRGERLSSQTDVYQLGAILFRGMVGHAPYKKLEGETDSALLERASITQEEIASPSTLGRPVNRDLEAICMKALRRARSQRYPSAGEMAADLRRYLKGAPVQARSWYQLREGIYSGLHSIWTYLAVLLLVFGIVGWTVYRSYQKAEEVRQHEEYLNHEEVEGCIASMNRYRSQSVVVPPALEFVDRKGSWPNPDVSHLTILRSSVYFDLSGWLALRRNTTPQNAGRIEPAYYTRVIELIRRAEVNPEIPTVSFQFRTGGYDVDLHCTTHPYKVYGSRDREYLGGSTKPVLVREIEVDLSSVPADGETVTLIVINGTIWNGFQSNADGKQWAAFLAPDNLTRGELAVKFLARMKPSQEPTLKFFAHTSPHEELPRNTQNFYNPPGKEWWIWRPRNIQRDRVYYMEWLWSPEKPN